MNKKNVFYDKYLVISFIYCIISLIKRLLYKMILSYSARFGYNIDYIYTLLNKVDCFSYIDDFYFYCLPIVFSLLFCIIYIRKNFINVKKIIFVLLLNILSAYVIFWGVYMLILILELVIFPFPN